MLKSNSNHGFHMTFKNGLTISVQFGKGNYCDRRTFNVREILAQENESVESKNAEIAIWDKNGVWFNFKSDTVKGWIDADEIAIWIDKVRRAKSIKTIKRIK